MSSHELCIDLAPDDAEGFQNFLATALQDSPRDIAEQLQAGLKKRFTKPPVAELELCLGRSVPVGKARQLLFAPGEEDMRLYPALIAMPPPEAPDNHPQRSVQICALASLFLVHSKRWERVKPFIEAGGLRQLALALAHPNAYLASQAMSTLLHITDEDLLFPWHDPPAAADGRGPRQGPYALVWRRMYELSGGPFLPNLLAHYRTTPAAFPGASGMALRLLAFYLSWMRRHFTQDGCLSLSEGLLDVLSAWSTDPGVTEEERQLAKQLHADFSRFPTAKPSVMTPGPDGSAVPGDDATAAQHHLGGLAAADEDEYSLTVVSERTEVNSGPSQDNEAEALRERGNEAYRRGDFSAAIHMYSSALDVLVPAERLLTEAPRRAAYHANRAAAYMARAAAGKLREGDADTTGHLEGVDHGLEGAAARHYEAAVIDCDMALDFEPVGKGAAKTLLRKCRALQRLGRTEEAIAAARAGLGKCDGGGADIREELQGELRGLEQRKGLSRPPASQHQGEGIQVQWQGLNLSQADVVRLQGNGGAVAKEGGGGGAAAGAGAGSSSGVDWSAMD